MDSLLGPLAFADIEMRSDIVCHNTLRIRHCRNCQPFGVFPAILAAIPDLALPSSGLRNAVPDSLIELGIVPPRSQQPGFLSNEFACRIAGTFDKCLIDADDDASGVGNNHALP